MKYPDNTFHKTLLIHSDIYSIILFNTCMVSGFFSQYFDIIRRKKNMYLETFKITYILIKHGDCYFCEVFEIF